MKIALRIGLVVCVAGFLAGLVVAGGSDDSKTPGPAGVLRDGFETPETTWESEHSDTTIRLLAHDRSQRAAHGGRLSEHFHFESGPGSHYFVSYATPKIPVSDDLRIGLNVRSDRAGVRLHAKVILPADVDPDTGAPSYVLVPGTAFDQVDRWQKLELVRMMLAIERQARVLRVSTRRPVKLDGAYVERVVVNLLGGPGETEVFLDDLEIDPVPQALLQNPARTAKGEKTAGSAAKVRRTTDPGRKATGQASIRLERNLLEKRGRDGLFHPWFPTAVDAPGANAGALRDLGFDVVTDSISGDPEKLRAAVSRGALIMARLPGATEADAPQRILEGINSYPLRDSVAFWQLGNHLGKQRPIAVREEELANLREAISTLHNLEEPDSRLTLGTVDGDLGLFARAPTGLDMIGIEPPFWCASQSFLESFSYMTQRRSLTVRSNLGVLFWGWIPASTPEEVIRNIWGDDTPPAWGTPPVQPTQLRQMTYLSLAAGNRAIAYAGNAELTRTTGPARALAIEMAFLNFEIDLCEQVLAQNEQKIRDYAVFDPEPLLVPSNAVQLSNRRPVQVKEQQPRWEMKAWAIPTADRKSVLLMVGDFANDSQFQPPQLAIDEVRVTPALPEGSYPFEISPGEVKALPRERVAEGTKITIQEFDTTSLILCTNDLSLGERLRLLVESIRPEAVSLAIEQSEILLQAVTEANGRLAADGHEFRSKVDMKRRRQAGIEGLPPDVPDLLAASQKAINSALEAMERQDYREAWQQARRAQRPLRIVMNGHWQQAYEAFRRATKTFYPLREGEVEIDLDTDLKPRKEAEIPKVSRRPTLLFSPVSCPPLVSFFTLPELYIWTDWIKGMEGFRWGRNRIPSGDFEDKEMISASGWVDMSYHQDGLIGKVSIVPRAESSPKTKEVKKSPTIRELDDANKGRVIKLEVMAERPKELDTVQPFLDFPVAAIRSPPIRVERNNLIRISVLVKRTFPSAPGAGGVIVRDSIGGEQFQFRTSEPIAEYKRVLLFRKAPGNGTFTVLLGLAGYGEALFDDLRVEVVEQDDGRAAPDLVRRGDPPRTMNSPRAPDPSTPAAAAATPRTGGSRSQPR